MAVQGVSGVAKDLAKMSSKSAVKVLAPAEDKSALFRWVALLTGSKNAVKGVGFVTGAILLGVRRLHRRRVRDGRGAGGDPDGGGDLHAVRPAGRAQGRKISRGLLQGPERQPPVGRAALPVRRARHLVRRRHPHLLLQRPVGRDAGRQPGGVLPGRHVHGGLDHLLRVRPGGRAPPAARSRPRPRGDRRPRAHLGGILTLIPAALGVAAWAGDAAQPSTWLTATIVVGLLLFGGAFALNSALHSYLILAFTKAARVTMDVGFYYMSNAAGRLVGTLLSGVSYQLGGLPLCLAAAALMSALSFVFAGQLQRTMTVPSADG